MVLYQAVPEAHTDAALEDPALRRDVDTVQVATVVGGAIDWQQEIWWADGRRGAEAAPVDTAIDTDIACPADCNARGVCDVAVGDCLCFEGYAGVDCAAVEPEALSGLTGSLSYRLPCGAPLAVTLRFDPRAVSATVTLRTGVDILTDVPDARMALLPGDVDVAALAADTDGDWLGTTPSTDVLVLSPGVAAAAASPLIIVQTSGRLCPASIVIDHEQTIAGGATTAPGSESSLAAGALVGIIIGAVLVLGSVIAAALFYSYRKKIRKADEAWQVDVDELEFDKLIGKGSFGEVRP